MSAIFRLPPSERDFEVFFKVAFHSVSTRDAAKFHNISQTRVRQLVTLVGDWVADNLPDWGEADLKKQFRLAQQVAANRLEHQYESAMRLWDVEGDPRHLRQAMRIALAQARLGVVAGRVHALAADVTEGPAELGDNFPAAEAQDLVAVIRPGNGVPRGSSLAEAQTRQEPRGSGFPGGSQGTSTPDEDCSPAEDYQGNGEEIAGEDFDASDSPETLIERERRQRLLEVEGASLFESRLLSLIAGQCAANPDKVAQLTETLARVRAHKATAELRLSRFIRGVQIEPLSAQPQHADTN